MSQYGHQKTKNKMQKGSKLIGLLQKNSDHYVALHATELTSPLNELFDSIHENSV